MGVPGNADNINHQNNFITSRTITPCAIIGVGNELAGDDGAGIVAVTRLKSMLQEPLRSRILLATLSGDLFSVTDYLLTVKRIIFIDAIIGETTPGAPVTIHADHSHTVSPSFHQTDIATVMQLLKKTAKYDSFPRWEIRGITILPPDKLIQGLSPAVSAAVNRLTRQITDELQQQYAPTSQHTVFEDPSHD